MVSEKYKERRIMIFVELRVLLVTNSVYLDDLKHRNFCSFPWGLNQQLLHARRPPDQTFTEVCKNLTEFCIILGTTFFGSGYNYNLLRETLFECM